MNATTANTAGHSIADTDDPGDLETYEGDEFDDAAEQDADAARFEARYGE